MKKLLFLILCLFAPLVILEIFICIFNVPSYLIPSFADVLVSIRENYSKLLYHWSITFSVALIGFLIANIFSVIISIITFRYKQLESIIISYAIFIKTIPIIAFAPLLILWFGSGTGSRIAVVILMCFFPALVNMLSGIKSISTTHLQLFGIYKATITQTILLLVIPSSLPYLFSSLKISISLAIVGAVISEFITTNKGLGFLIITGYYTLDIPLVFTSIFLASLSGLLGYLIIDYIEKKVINWESYSN